MFSTQWQREAGKKGGRPLGYLKPGAEPTKHPKLRDIAWAAGVWEGEGSIEINGRKDSSNGHTMTVNVSQKDRELCDRLRELFGGGVFAYNSKHPRTGVLLPQFRWHISGSRAVGFILTIYAFLTERRKKQVKEKLDEWKKTRSST